MFESLSYIIYSLWLSNVYENYIKFLLVRIIAFYLSSAEFINWPGASSNWVGNK